MTKILMFSGSSRKDSLNKKLISATVEIAQELGNIVTLIDLADYPLPLYDGDLEAVSGVPDNAQKLHLLLQEHDAFIIASPEYNGLPSPLLINTLDWVSRLEGNVYSRKSAAIMSASPGAMGGLRGLPHLRTLLNNLNVLVIPRQFALGSAFSAFDDDGSLKDEKHHAIINTIIEELTAIS